MKKEERAIISVVVPIYNVEEFLERSIESIVNQTFKELEIILVDDGSTDKCPELCDYFASRDDRIKVIHKKNGGLSDARNEGLKYSTGEYICFIDSDDLIKSNMIEELYSAIRNEGAELAICNYIKCDESDNIIEKISETKDIIIYDKVEAFENFLLEKSRGFVVAWNKLYKRELFDGIEYPKGKIHEDCFTTWKLYLRASKIIYLNQCLYLYRIRKGSIMNSAKIEKEQDAIEAFELIKEYLNVNQIVKKELFEYRYLLVNIQVTSIIREFKDLNYVREAKERISNIKIFTNEYLSINNKVRSYLLKTFPRLYILLNRVIYYTGIKN